MFSKLVRFIDTLGSAAAGFHAVLGPTKTYLFTSRYLNEPSVLGMVRASIPYRMRSFVLLIPPVLTSIVSQAQSPAHTAHFGIGRVAGSTTVKELTPAELKAMLGKSNLFLFDRNEVDMFAGAHVPGPCLRSMTLSPPIAYRSSRLRSWCSIAMVRNVRLVPRQPAPLPTWVTWMSIVCRPGSRAGKMRG